MLRDTKIQTTELGTTLMRGASLTVLLAISIVAVGIRGSRSAVADNLVTQPDTSSFKLPIDLTEEPKDEQMLLAQDDKQKFSSSKEAWGRRSRIL